MDAKRIFRHFMPKRLPEVRADLPLFYSTPPDGLLGLVSSKAFVNRSVSIKNFVRLK